MYNIIINNINDKYDYNELIKIFLKPAEYRLFTKNEYEGPQDDDDVVIEFNNEEFDDKNQIKRGLYRGLSSITKSAHP